MACLCPCLAAMGICIGCAGWCCHRAELTGNTQSEGWPDAKVYEVDDFPRTATLVLAAYEEDLSKPSAEFPEEGKELLQRVQIVRKTGYKETQDRCPPYLIAIDHEEKDITLAVRGLNLAKVKEYMTLLDNRKGKQKFNEGFVHHGMLRSAGYLLDDEMDNLNALMLRHKEYTLTLAGHSLGSGVVCLMALVLVQNLGELRGITKDRIRCHCFAPSRCVSINLAVSCADIVSSVILQDDFLPRMNYPLETIFGFYFCLPCVLQWACCVDFFLPQKKLVQDPRRLYPPGRLYHIVYTEGGKCALAELPPDARVGVPVDGRFEKLIVSRTTHSDHLLTTIFAKLKTMMEAMEEKQEEWLSAPVAEKMRRMETLQRDKVEDMVAALERAQSLNVPNAINPTEAYEADKIFFSGALFGTSLAEAEGAEESGKAADAAARFKPTGVTEAGVAAAEQAADAKPELEKQKSATQKWSRLIDEIIAKEGAEAHSAEDAKPVKKWSFVKRAVKEGKLQEGQKEEDTTQEEKEKGSAEAVEEDDAKVLQEKSGEGKQHRASEEVKGGDVDDLRVGEHEKEFEASEKDHIQGSQHPMLIDQATQESQNVGAPQDKKHIISEAPEEPKEDS